MPHAEYSQRLLECRKTLMLSRQEIDALANSYRKCLTNPKENLLTWKRLIKNLLRKSFDDDTTKTLVQHTFRELMEVYSANDLVRNLARGVGVASSYQNSPLTRNLIQTTEEHFPDRLQDIIDALQLQRFKVLSSEVNAFSELTSDVMVKYGIDSLSKSNTSIARVFSFANDIITHHPEHIEALIDKLAIIQPEWSVFLHYRELCTHTSPKVQELLQREVENCSQSRWKSMLDDMISNTAVLDSEVAHWVRQQVHERSTDPSLQAKYLASCKLELPTAIEFLKERSDEERELLKGVVQQLIIECQDVSFCDELMKMNLFTEQERQAFVKFLVLQSAFARDSSKSVEVMMTLAPDAGLSPSDLYMLQNPETERNADEDQLYRYSLQHECILSMSQSTLLSLVEHSTEAELQSFLIMYNTSAILEFPQCLTLLNTEFIAAIAETEENLPITSMNELITALRQEGASVEALVEHFFQLAQFSSSQIDTYTTHFNDNYLSLVISGFQPKDITRYTTDKEIQFTAEIIQGCRNEGFSMSEIITATRSQQLQQAVTLGMLTPELLRACIETDSPDQKRRL